jgi:predicted component of type VI protein secretion system
VLHRRPSLLLIGQLVVAVASAAAVALIYVAVSSPSSNDGSALRMWQSVKAVLPPAPRRAPTLMVRNQSAFVNETLPLGVSVDHADSGATVTVKGLPANARLTAGMPTSLTEWRMPADEASGAKVLPPSDFVGAVDLSTELHNPDGTVLVASVLQLSWREPPAPPPVTTAAVTPSPQPLPAPSALPPQPEPTASPAETMSANAIAALVRRAQEMLATGDIREARSLLTQAAEAHDARAALILARTFDPNVSRQSAATDPAPDVAQARGWYQRAREWGSPDAQRQLDALASYR